ncbi:MAG: amino acid ABC transporter permease [Rhodoluna sp.]
MPASSDAKSDDVIAVPLRHPWRWVSAVIIVLVLGLFVYSLWASPNINHDIVSTYLFNGKVMAAAWLTVFLTVVSMLIGTILAIILAVMKLSVNPVLKLVANGYIGFFRGTPLLLQVVFWGYLGIIYPTIDIGIPFTDMIWWSEKTSLVFTSLIAGIIALSLNEAAYAAEIVRAGILSVDTGQAEAAKSLGMGSGYTLRRIVLPQAMRVIIPPLGNEFISMLKNTSLLQVVAVMELYARTSQISSQNLAQVELLVVAGFWYLVMTTILSFPQSWLEKKYGRGFSATNERARWMRIGMKGNV